MRRAQHFSLELAVAAHMADMSNDIRHQKGTPASRGGQFKPQNRSEADTTLSYWDAFRDDREARQTVASESARELLEMKKKHWRLMVDTIAANLVDEFPGATRALFVLDKESERFTVWEVRDAAGTPLSTRVNGVSFGQPAARVYLNDIGWNTRPFEKITLEEEIFGQYMVALDLVDRENIRVR